MTIEYNFKHDAEAVYELLTDPQFLVDRCIALGGLSADGEAEEKGDDWVVTTHRETVTDLPAFLQKILGSEQHYSLTETWQADGDGWCGNMNVHFEDQPFDIRAKFELQPTKTGCVYKLSPRAKANIPLIGKKVEKFILEQFHRDAESELDYTQDFLEQE